MIELLESAEHELLAASDWYEEQQPGLGQRFLSEAERTADRIEEQPHIGSLWTLSSMPSGVRRLQLRTFPYHLVYVDEPRLVIVAVAHMSRRPGYWHRRLRQL